MKGIYCEKDGVYPSIHIGNIETRSAYCALIRQRISTTETNDDMQRKSCQYRSRLNHTSSSSSSSSKKFCSIHYQGSEIEIKTHAHSNTHTHTRTHTHTHLHIMIVEESNTLFLDRESPKNSGVGGCWVGKVRDTQTSHNLNHVKISY